MNCGFMKRYAELLRNMIIEGVDSESDRLHPLRSMKIAVDAGNGVGGFYAYDVLAPLGADISGSVILSRTATSRIMPRTPRMPRLWTASQRRSSARIPTSA